MHSNSKLNVLTVIVSKYIKLNSNVFYFYMIPQIFIIYYLLSVRLALEFYSIYFTI